MNTRKNTQADFPILNSLTLIYLSSCLIAIMMLGASLLGIFYQSRVYPTHELLSTFVSNDIVNIGIGLPILLGSMWLAWRGKLIGLLCWVGALSYVIYNYLAYLFAVPFSGLFLLYLILVVLGLYVLIALLMSINGELVKQSLAGAVPERFGGAVLAGFGLLFIIRVIWLSIDSVYFGKPLSQTDLAVNISDFFISPALLIGGILLWRRKALGYVAGLGLLFQNSMLFIALIAFLLLQSLLMGAPLAISDIVVVLVMGLVCFIPFVLFVRGVVATQNISSTDQ